ncbi:MAG: helix-turn-helix domain-containing protein [Oscillospiraceae bacterium]|nr:helix-turn-helix domain-containing protein [Oscillospiraceae bacterium]
MGRIKGSKSRHWTEEERLKYVLMCEEDHMPVRTVAREFGIPRGTLTGWVNRYRTGGNEALNPEKLRPGNTFSPVAGVRFCLDQGGLQADVTVGVASPPLLFVLFLVTIRAQCFHVVTVQCD